MNFKRGKKDTSFLPPVRSGGRDTFPIAVYAKDGVWLQLSFIRNYPPASDPAFRAELHRRLDAAGAKVPVEWMAGFPEIPYEVLVSDTTRAGVLDALNWLVGEFRKVGTTK